MKYESPRFEKIVHHIAQEQRGRGSKSRVADPHYLGQQLQSDADTGPAPAAEIPGRFQHRSLPTCESSHRH